MKINNFDTTSKVFIIAEIGNNHEGDLQLAKELIDRAIDSGADAVKFQTIVPELFVSTKEKERVARLKKFQFTTDQFFELSNYSKEREIIFFSTPFDLVSAEFLNTIQPVFKIASGDNNFFPLIDKVSSFGKPMIISTGLSNYKLLENLEKRVNNKWSENQINPGLAFLHCITSYPVPLSQSYLGTISSLKKKFANIDIGYSDHTIGIDASIYAVAAGARIIEKHFTIDKNYSDFRDHKLSADPLDLKEMVSRIRELELMLGDRESDTLECENELLITSRRSIACANNLKKGDRITEADIIWIRPGNGISPGNENKVLGKILLRDISIGEIFSNKDFY